MCKMGWSRSKGGILLKQKCLTSGCKAFKKTCLAQLGLFQVFFLHQTFYIKLAIIQNCDKGSCEEDGWGTN